MSSMPVEHYKGINFPYKFNLQKYRKIKDNIDCMFIKHLNLIRRIGSESLHAKVYSGRIDNTIVAVKILKDIDQFENELYINEFIFEDPMNSLFFLYLIKGYICEDKGIFVMEMAISDLKQKINFSYITEDESNDIVSNVLLSILKLAELGIYHGDLHLGNIFLVLRNNNIRAVIGDFGESSPTTSPTSSSSDLFEFIRGLLEYIDEPEILDKLNLFYGKIGKLSGRLEDDFDLYLEKMDEQSASIKCNVEFIKNAINVWEKL